METVSSMKYQLLRNNYENFIHPLTGLPIRLFRIIAMRDFEISIDEISIQIKEGDIGGLIQNEKNLSHDDSSWVMNQAKVFDNAILSNSIIRDESWIFGQSVLENTITTGKSFIYGKQKSLIQESVIMDQLSIQQSKILRF